LIETKGAFWQVGMGTHVLQRGMEVLNGRRFIPGYYLLTTWVSLFPWLFFIVPVWRATRARWSAASAFLIAWFIAPQLVFFFYATQLPHYVMPGYSAFLILLAMAWNGRQADEQRRFPAIGISGTAILGGLALVILGASWLIPITNEPLRDLVRAAGLTLTLLLLGGGMAAAYLWTKRGTSTVLVALAAMVSLSASVLSLAENVRRTSITIQCAESLQSMPAVTRCLGCGYDEPSLVHYTAFKWEMGGNAVSARAFLEKGGPCAVVLLRREWTLDGWLKTITGSRQPGVPAKDYQAEVDALVTSFPGLEYQVVEGFNGARSSWSEVVLLVRRR
jgi:4-amino-4-deoxy-L-arabinose transferase-like glycosyltransferase